MDKLTEGTAPDKVPALVLALAQKAATERVPNPIPIKWRDEGNSIYVQFEDGRAILFDLSAGVPAQADPPEVRPAVEKPKIVDSPWHETVDKANLLAQQAERKKKR